MRAGANPARMTPASMIDLKLCGLRDPAHIDAAVGAGATHIGLVRFARSPRHVSMDEAAALADHARGRAQVVVVTVNADDGEIDALIARVRPDMVQLHGAEAPERAAALRERVPVIKAMAVRTRADLARADAYAPRVDALLLDARPPEGSDLPGGNGVGFDWSILRGFAPPVPWFLSGGLNADNVAEAIRSGARALDLSSGIEDAPGVKSLARIRAVGEAVRAATLPA